MVLGGTKRKYEDVEERGVEIVYFSRDVCNDSLMLPFVSYECDPRCLILIDDH
jgi:hypothetical protein